MLRLYYGLTVKGALLIPVLGFEMSGSLSALHSALNWDTSGPLLPMSQEYLPEREKLLTPEKIFKNNYAC